MHVTTKNKGSNYLAKFVKLPPVRKHPNADKLQLVDIDYNTVVVGLNAKEGDLYCYFPLECAINKDFLRLTNSFSDASLNSDSTKKGFFNDKGRVKAARLRGIPSNGYLVPAEEILTFVGEAGYLPELNQEFDTLNEVLLCEKYVPPNQHVKGPANTPKTKKEVRHNRIIEGQFHFHVDTANLKKNLHAIQPGDTITISEKLHGTSAVFSRVLVRRKLKWYEKLAKRFGLRIQESEYGLVYSSRQVIKNQYEKIHNHYYGEDIWGIAAKEIEPHLKDGVSIYAEIVGQTPNGRWIQKNYDYGCKPNEHKVFVYRMTYTNPSGEVFEFTTNQIKRYCENAGLNMVPIHYYGTADGFVWGACNGDPDISSFPEIMLRELQGRFPESNCTICNNKVPAEGIVVTVEKNQFEAYKLKSFLFLEGESKMLDNNDIGIEGEQ